MIDYQRQTADRAANLRHLNKQARSQGVTFGYKGQSTAAMDGGSDIAVLELKLKRGAVIPVTLAEASTVGAVDISGPLRQIVQARPEDSHRALHEMSQSLKAQYRDACVGRFVSATDDIDPVLVTAFAQIMEAE
jgi:hypothetical protein